MKRIGIWFCFFVLFTLTLCGCEGRKEQETGYMVYYVNAERTKLLETKYIPSAQTFDEMMEELTGQLENPPINYFSALPDGVKFNGYERGIDALRIDFSKGYYNLNNTDEVLLRAAVVKTFAQISGVTKVMITVEKEQLRDNEGHPVPAMNANSFIDTEGGINSYLHASLVLYFADSSGKILVQEIRNHHYSSNMVLERVVVEQLIDGPDQPGLRSILDGSVRIQSINVKNGICTINFDDSVNKAPYSAGETGVEPQVALYGIVNSICATCENISGVKFEINGTSDVRFRDAVDLNQVFMKNQNMVRKEEVTERESEQIQRVSEFPKDYQPEVMTEAADGGNGEVAASAELTVSGE